MSLAILLRCNALEVSRRFYQDILGFRIENLNDNSISAQCGDAEIMLTTLDLWQALPQMSGTIYIGVDEVDAYFSHLKERVEIIWPLQDMPYGTREFAIRDCNGYILAFMQKH